MSGAFGLDDADPAAASAAQGQILFADLAGFPLAASGFTRTSFPDAAGPDQGQLDVGLLGNETIDLGDGIQLPLLKDGDGNGLIDLGMLGLLHSYSASDSAVHSTAAVGFVDSGGEISLSPNPGEEIDPAYVDLTDLFAQAGIDGLTDEILDQARLELGAIGARAESTNDIVDSEYRIADLNLRLRSPLVGDLTNAVDSIVNEAIGPVSDLVAEGGALNGLLDSLAGALSGIDVGIAKVEVTGSTVAINGVDALVETITDALLANPIGNNTGSVTLDLNTGMINLDVAKLLAETPGGGDINDLDPNTEVFSTAFVSAVAVGVSDSIAGITDVIADTLLQGLEDLEVVLDVGVDLKTLVGTLASGHVFVKGSLADFTGTSGTLPKTTTDLSLAGLNLGLILNPATNLVVGAVTGTLGPVVGDALDLVTDNLTPTVTELVEGLLSPLDPVLEGIFTNLLSLRINEQPTEPHLDQDGGDLGSGSFTVRALSLTLLPVFDTGGQHPVSGLAKIALASATVRSAADAPAVDVTIDNPTAGQEYQIEPGQSGIDVTVDGTGEPGADITVTVGDDTFTTTVDDDGTWSVVVPDLGPGDHTVTAAQDADGETSSASVDFTVNAPADNDSYEPAYAPTDAVPNQPATSEPPTYTDANDEATDAPEGATYALAPGGPAGATIDPATGVVTWTPADGDAGETVTVAVIVSYADGTTDSVDAPFAVGSLADAYAPAYETTSALPGVEVTSDAPTFAGGPAGASGAPDGTVFALGTDAPDGATIDGATGEITWTPPLAAAGTEQPIPVVVTYADGSSDDVIALFDVGSLADAFTPAYAPTEAQPNVQAVSGAPTFTNSAGEPVEAPAETTFALGEGAPDGATVDPNTGVVTWTPGIEDANAVTTIPVEVTYADGSTETATAAFNVGDVRDVDFYTPAYTATPATPGVSATSASPTFTDIDGETVSAPAGTTYAIGDGAPEGAEVNATTGAVTWTPGYGDAGTVVDIPVAVTYPDGTTETVDAPFDVDSVASALVPAYEPTEAQPGQPAVSEEPTFTGGSGETVDAPEGTTFALGDDAPTGATIDPETGVITWTPGIDDANRTVDIPVIVTYPDGSTDDAEARFEVASLASILTPSYPETPAIPGVEATSDAPSYTDAADEAADAPANTTYALADGAPVGATIDPQTGEVTWTAPLDEAGETRLIPVVVLYADGSSDAVDAPFVVADFAVAFTPAYPTTPATPGVEVTTAPPTFTDAAGQETDAPEGTTFVLGEGAPDGATIDETTGAITWTPPLDAPNTTVTIPVTVVYPDESSDDVDAPFEIGDLAGQLTPAYGTTEATVGEPATSEPPTFTAGDDEANAPTGTTFALGDDAPEGADIDAETGVVTWTPGQADSGQVVEIPVVVTYPDGSTDDAVAPFAVLDANANASASAAASANADDDSNAAAQAAAQAAATADADTTASAAADASAEAAAAVAANADASSNASTDVSADANAAAAAAAQTSGNADASSQAEANASAASSAAADVNAAAAADASAAAAANAEASSNASADASADANADLNANAAASASASANADDDSNAAAQAAAQAAATADADTTASAAADASAEAAAAVAANADASSDASTDATSEANAAAVAAASAAANGDNSSTADADASAAASASADSDATAQAAAAADAAAIADASSDASAQASATADADATAESDASAEAADAADASAEAAAAADATAEAAAAADATDEAAATADAAATSSAAANGSGGSDGGGLPGTGADLNVAAIVGAVLLALLGAGAVVVAKRRNG